MYWTQGVGRLVSRWQAALLVLACLAFSSGAWAQQRGFFIYPGSYPGASATKYISTSVVAAAIECEKFDAFANKEMPLKCKFIPTQPSKEYKLDRPPAVLLFSVVNPFCYWDTARQVWNCVP